MVVGFCDLGNEKTFEPALNVLTLLVKGMYNNWKQPLAYFFVHNCCSAADLKDIIFTSLRKLKEIGLKPRLIVSDMGPSNIKLSKNLKISEETPYFTVDNEKIFYMFDPPHLIKAIRNVLYTNNFVYEGNFASWKHIEDMYNIDKTLACRLAPRLTSSHVHPINRLKMKVSLATQTISSSVANAIGALVCLGHMNAKATETQRFIEEFDKLFDVFNSSTVTSPKKYKRPFKAEGYQIEFLNSITTYLRNVKIVNKNQDCK